MKNRRAPNVQAAHRRLWWAIFGGLSILALGAGVGAGVAAGGRSTGATVLLGGLIVLGIAAALLGSIISPIPRHDGSMRMSHGARGMAGDGFGGVGVDGGGFGGGCGDGGGSCS